MADASGAVRRRARRSVLTFSRREPARAIQATPHRSADARMRFAQTMRRHRDHSEIDGAGEGNRTPDIQLGKLDGVTFPGISCQSVSM